jgi:hypothetical protein
MSKFWLRTRELTKVYPEEKIEHALVTAVKRHGGHAYKFTSPGRRGVPDRVVLMPNCGVMSVTFVETKASGKTLRPDQEHEIQYMRERGAYVKVIDSFTGIGEFIEMLKRIRQGD